MEKVVLPPEGSLMSVEKPWATTGKPNSRERNIITSLFIQPEKMEAVNLQLQRKYRALQCEARYEMEGVDGADVLIVSFGLTARISQKAIELAREKGLKVGIFRPITLYPFPTEALAAASRKVASLLVVELNAGQMVEDVRLAVNGKRPVYFKGRMGGIIITPEEILEELELLAQNSHSHLQDIERMEEVV